MQLMNRPFLLLKQIPYGLATSLLFVVAWPPRGFSVLLFVAFVPLFMLGSKKNVKPIESAVVAFIAFFVVHFFSAGWMYSSTFTGTLITHFFNAFVFSMVFLLWTASAKFLSAFRLLVFLSLWLSMEYLHTIWGPAWPWFSLGNGLAENTNWIQWYSFTGVQGGSLWILIVNWMIFKAVSAEFVSDWRKLTTIVIVLLLLITLPIVYSYYLLDQNKQMAVYPVALIQPNINPRTEKFNGISEKEQVKRTMNMIKDENFDHVGLVVFPETFLTTPIDEDSVMEASSIQTLMSQFSNIQSVSLFVGAFTRRDSVAAVQDQDAVIHSKNPYVLYNSAIMLHEKNSQIYHKTKLLPLVEKQLFVKLLNPLRAYIENSGAFFGSYGTFNESNLYTLKDCTVVAPIICFESVFGDYIANNVQSSNPDFIVLITNDGWWNSDAGYFQHLAYARLRCIETNRWMVRCANTGVSAIIDNHGTIIQQTNYGEASVLFGNVGMKPEKNTFYVLHGNLIGKYSLIIMFLGLVAIFSIRTNSRLKRNNNKQSP